MSEADKLIEVKGAPYVSLEALRKLVSDMADFVDRTVEENPGTEALLPGSEAVLALLDGIFTNMQVEFAKGKDLGPEAEQTMKDIYDFLGEQ